jgi:pimeloyl-ACP methyl ester carboxylesterase
MFENICINGVNLKLNRISNGEDHPTLIFLHDSLGCIELWRDFPKKLGYETKCNVLIYDRQGYGKSDSFSTERKADYLEIEADILNLLIKECKIQHAILFGHSDGGSIALIAAAKYPTSIKGVISEGAHIFVEDITLTGIKKAIEVYHTTNLKERLKKYHGDKTEAVFWAWANTWLAADFKSWNIESFLPLIECPVLVIQGENDEYGSLAQVNGIIKQIPTNAKKLIIPFIGHTPHKEAQEKVQEHSVTFINHLINNQAAI